MSIELRVEDPRQLFNSLEPSPFRAKDLDDDAEEYIVGWTRELPRDAGFLIVIHLPEEETCKESALSLEEAFRNYLAYGARSRDARSWCAPCSGSPAWAVADEDPQEGPCPLALVVLSVVCLQACLSHPAGAGKGVKPVGAAGPESSDPPSKPPTARTSKPDLVVADVALDDQCRVALEIRHEGKGDVSDTAFRKGTVRVVAEARQVLTPLAKADPKGELKTPGGSVRVECGFLLDKPARVRSRPV